MSDTPRDCKHGQLARSCELCELERENAALREQLAVMTQAVGLASTIKGEMPMRPDDPVGMMQEVVAFVASMHEQLAERDAEIAALKGHAFDQESSARRRYSNVAPWEIDS